MRWVITSVCAGAGFSFVSDLKHAFLISFSRRTATIANSFKLQTPPERGEAPRLRVDAYVAVFRSFHVNYYTALVPRTELSGCLQLS